MINSAPKNSREIAEEILRERDCAEKAIGGSVGKRWERKRLLNDPKVTLAQAYLDLLREIEYAERAGKKITYYEERK